MRGAKRERGEVLRWLLFCAMAPKPYYRRWAVWLRGERIGEVLAATERAACLRAIQRFRISFEDRAKLEVRRVAASHSE